MAWVTSYVGRFGNAKRGLRNSLFKRPKLEIGSSFGIRGLQGWGLVERGAA